MLFWARLALVFIVISDFLDGYLARQWGEITPLGGFLDPLADKLFVMASYILLAVFDKIPAWLTIIVVSKDLLVTFGWCFMALIYQRPEVKPSTLGKIATALQFITVCVIVLLPSGFPLFGLEYITALLTIAALLHYAFLAMMQANGPASGSEPNS